MSRSDDAAGGGCFLLIAAVVVVSLIITYWWQILTATLIIGGVALFVRWAVRSHREAMLLAEQRRRCPVCQSWIDSVILAEFNPIEAALLCPDHAARWQRITGLEGEVLRGD